MKPKGGFILENDWKEIDFERDRWREINKYFYCEAPRTVLADTSGKYLTGEAAKRWYYIQMFLKDFAFAYVKGDYDEKRGPLFLEAIQTDTSKEGIKATARLTAEIYNRAKVLFGVVWLKDIDDVSKFPVKVELVENRFWGVEPDANVYLHETAKFLIMLYRDDDLYVYTYEKKGIGEL